MKPLAFMLLLFALCCFIVGVVAAVKEQEERKTVITPSRRCWPISPSLSKGTVRCWSGGQLVYNRAIYHNGGVLCSVSGRQITLNKADLCVIESRQADVWSPPPPVDR